MKCIIAVTTKLFSLLMHLFLFYYYYCCVVSFQAKLLTAFLHVTITREKEREQTHIERERERERETINLTIMFLPLRNLSQKIFNCFIACLSGKL